jgi:hypothetical protein
MARPLIPPRHFLAALAQLGRLAPYLRNSRLDLWPVESRHTLGPAAVSRPALERTAAFTTSLAAIGGGTLVATRRRASFVTLACGRDRRALGVPGAAWARGTARSLGLRAPLHALRTTASLAATATFGTLGPFAALALLGLTDGAARARHDAHAIRPRAQPKESARAFFDHGDHGLGPADAERVQALLDRIFQCLASEQCGGCHVFLFD